MHMSNGNIRLEKVDRDAIDCHARFCEDIGECPTQLSLELRPAGSVPAEYVHHMGMRDEKTGIGVDVMGIPGISLALLKQIDGAHVRRNSCRCGRDVKSQ